MEVLKRVEHPEDVGSENPPEEISTGSVRTENTCIASNVQIRRFEDD